MELPDEMIVEVMRHFTSLDTLACFRASAKFLNVLSYDTEFMAQLPVFSGFIHPTKVRWKQSIGFSDVANAEWQPHTGIKIDFLEERKVSIKACSDATGLVLCKYWTTGLYYEESEEFYICKPTTKECLQILSPDSYAKCKYGLTVMSLHPFHFKVVRLSSIDDHCEVFDSKSPTRWRKLEGVGMRCDFRILGPSVTLNGFIHFLADTSEVFAFDTIEERWITFSLPRHLAKYLSKRRFLIKYKGKLSLLVFETYYIHSFWILEDYQNKAWKKKSQYRVFWEDHRRIKTLHFFHSDPDLERFIKLWITLLVGTRDEDVPIWIQSDFQKSKWPLEAKRMQEAGSSMDHLNDINSMDHWNDISSMDQGNDNNSMDQGNHTSIISRLHVLALFIMYLGFFMICADYFL